MKWKWRRRIIKLGKEEKAKLEEIKERDKEYSQMHVEEGDTVKTRVKFTILQKETIRFRNDLARKIADCKDPLLKQLSV